MSDETPEKAGNCTAWTIDQLCDQLNCSRSFLYGEIRNGRLAAHKLGRHTRILEAERRRYVDCWRRIQPSSPKSR